MNDKYILGNISYLEVWPFVATLKAMNRVVEDSFSTRAVGPNLSKHIEELKSAFESTGLSETLKSHVALNHIEHSLFFLGCSGCWGVNSQGIPQVLEQIPNQFN